MRLKHLNAIVTGAGSGIGRAIAKGFAAEGARVAAADISLGGAQRTAQAIKDKGGEAMAIEVDVSQRSQVVGMLNKALGAFNGVDILVAAAGIGGDHAFLEMEEEDWDRVIAVNLKGLFLCGQLLARHMVEAGKGSIIMVTSTLADVALPNSAHYAAAKGGAKLLTKAMALELAPLGVRVNAIAPGLTKTNMTQLDTEAGHTARIPILEKTPLGRAAEPEEMVGAAVYLACDDSSYVTGSTIVVDGGYLIH
jgi:NAD(P)-dependent dehydrogenase (short-subunit alcohol dehydrogenase family)